MDQKNFDDGFNMGRKDREASNPPSYVCTDGNLKCHEVIYGLNGKPIVNEPFVIRPVFKSEVDFAHGYLAGFTPSTDN